MREQFVNRIEKRLVGHATPAPARSLADLETQLGADAPVLSVLRGLGDLLRDHWPWLLPLLIWVGVGSYRRERHAVRGRRAG